MGENSENLKEKNTEYLKTNEEKNGENSIKITYKKIKKK